MGVRGPTLGTNQALYTGDYLMAGDGMFIALMQSDGNLVVYPGVAAATRAPGGEQGAIWASNSYNSSGQCVALMQSDGNFVIYPTPDAVGKDPTQQTGAIWASNSSGSGGQFTVYLDRRGVLWVMSGYPGPGGNASVLWTTGDASDLAAFEEQSSQW